MKWATFTNNHKSKIFQFVGSVVRLKARMSSGKRENFNTHRIIHRPLFVANMTMGAIADSNDLCKYVNVSRSNICTSSMNRTPGTNSAIP